MSKKEITNDDILKGIWEIVKVNNKIVRKLNRYIGQFEGSDNFNNEIRRYIG